MDPAVTIATRLACSTLLLAGCALPPRVGEAPFQEPIASPAPGEQVSVELLERYDSGRIPVLFVHGIGGSPRDFEAALGSLDRQRFQAWVLRYPTDTRLQVAASGMGQRLDELRRRHGHARLIIVAHSMGGLVARRYLLDARNGEGEGPAHALVTFSSPWNGNAWAGIGARFVPDPPGPWIDLSPDSDFLLALRDAMPGVPHYVFFGYRRAASLLTSQSSDGAITLESQIPGWIQEQARRTWGYDADHAGILSHAAALDRLHALLALEAGR
jgi:pimeloyl-ACP methyl ester carboxylesterase